VSWAAESVRVTVDKANLRSQPNTTSVIVAKVDRGTTLTVLGREGAWVRVAAPNGGAVSYISARLCEPLAAAAPVAPAATSQQTPPPTPAKSKRGSDSVAEPLQFGAQASWATDGIGLGLGVRASKGIPVVRGLGALVTFDFLFGARSRAAVPGVTVDSSGHSFQLGLFPTYSREFGEVRAYAGAGLSLLHTSYSVSATVPQVPDTPPVEVSASGSSTSLGIVAGAKYAGRFFGEVRYQFGDASHLTFSVGVVFDSPW
jgi:hypothetical protein